MTAGKRLAGGERLPNGRPGECPQGFGRFPRRLRWGRSSHGSGGRTKWNRTIRQLPKTHWLDAACVGASTPERVTTIGIIPLTIRAIGRQRRQMCLVDKYGFPRTKGKGKSVVQGFRTGDTAKAIIPTGAKVGTYVGRVAVWETGSFNITTMVGTIQGLNAQYCTVIHQVDDYSYQKARSV